jgi:hypothetical protein
MGAGCVTANHWSRIQLPYHLVHSAPFHAHLLDVFKWALVLLMRIYVVLNAFIGIAQNRFLYAVYAFVGSARLQTFASYGTSRATTYLQKMRTLSSFLVQFIEPVEKCTHLASAPLKPIATPALPHIRMPVVVYTSHLDAHVLCGTWNPLHQTRIFLGL